MRKIKELGPMRRELLKWYTDKPCLSIEADYQTETETERARYYERLVNRMEMAEIRAEIEALKEFYNARA